MKKSTAIKLVAVVLVAAAIAAAAAFRDLLPLLRYAGVSAEDLEKKSQAAKQTEEEIRKEYQIPEIVLTPEEQAALNNSEKTAEEIAAALLQKQREEQDPAGSEVPAEPPSEDRERLQNLVAQLYVLQNSFTAQVDALIETCKQEYRALDESQQTRANKIKIVTARMSDITSMEKDCDSRVEAILKEVEGVDAALAKQLRTEYQNTKATKKADLISRYS